MRKAFFIVLAVVFIACSSSPVPRGIMPPDKMQKVVYDLMQTDEFFNSYLVRDTNLNLKKERSIYYEKVFKLHNTNRKDFYTSFQYYQKHPNIQKTLFDSLYEEAKRRKSGPAITTPPAIKKES